MKENIKNTSKLPYIVNNYRLNDKNITPVMSPFFLTFFTLDSRF